MSEIYSFPNNQDEYVGAENLMRWFHGRTSGVWGADNNARVSAMPEASMNVQVSDGLGWLANNQADGIVWWNNSIARTGSALALTIAGADPSLPRIDRVIVTWPTIDYVARPEIKILQGKPAGQPIPAALTNDSSVRQISLAQIRVAAGALKITAADITDERLDPEVCGLVTESASIDTGAMNDQFRALLKAIEDELASITGGTGFDPAPVRVHNVKIAPSLFQSYMPSGTEETGLHNDLGYEFKAQVPVSGVTSNMTPYVTFSLPSMDKAGAGIANQIACYNGGIVLYADGKPEAEITALTVECRKAVG